MAKRPLPEVNAGSMADIAFLLLIFFLVTTTIESDYGITRKLPPIQDENVEPPVIKERNIFKVLVNSSDELLVEDDLMELKDLREAAIAFLDNGGAGKENWSKWDTSSQTWGQSGKLGCSYCKGKRDPESSDNPDKAIISLKNDRKTSYNMYLSVQNELVAAYNELRNRRALELGPAAGFPDMNYIQMVANEKDVRWVGNKVKLKKVIDQVKFEYPQKLSEVQQK